MLQQGELQALPGVTMFVLRALQNPYIIGGTVLAAVSYFCYLSALSLKDLTIAFLLRVEEATACP